MTPFASFSANIKAEIGPNVAENELEVKGNFTLAEGSSINPLNEPVVIKIGGFEITIPAGSFKWFEHPKNPEKNDFRFEGTIEGVSVEMKIKPLGSGNYEFKFEAEELNLSWITDSVTARLTIGDDFGEIEVTPEIEH